MFGPSTRLLFRRTTLLNGKEGVLEYKEYEKSPTLGLQLRPAPMDGCLDQPIRIGVLGVSRLRIGTQGNGWMDWRGDRRKCTTIDYVITGQRTSLEELSCDTLLFFIL